MSKASKRAWYLANCTDCWKRARAWREANPERHRENQRRWRAAHPGYAKARCAARAEKLLNARSQRVAAPTHNTTPDPVRSTSL